MCQGVVQERYDVKNVTDWTTEIYFTIFSFLSQPTTKKKMNLGKEKEIHQNL
jgi:hypothetical protein